MKKTPYEADVRRALRATKQAVRRALKGANQVAGQVLARGRYDEAEALTGRARRIREFLAEVDALTATWREATRMATSRPSADRSSVTPLWAFYQPILQALVEAGGTATRKELEPLVASRFGSQLQAGDRKQMAGSRQRWQVMIARARKQLVAEGWIESRGGSSWKITSSGRRAATRELSTAAKGE